MTRVTKTFRFEAAHRLITHNGLCKNLHGHSYKAEVTVSGEVSPATGMVLDFSYLSKIVKKIVTDEGEAYGYTPLDHSVILNELDTELVGMCKKMGFRIFEMRGEPTAENLAEEIATRILSQVGSNLNLESVRLWETENSYAEWKNDYRKNI